MKFSIIIPIYQTERYLAGLKASLEKAAAKMREMEIEFLFEEDRNGAGVSRTRNAAIERATGDWIGFVDSDDLVSEDWFANVERIIIANPDADIVRMGPQIDFADQCSSMGLNFRNNVNIPFSNSNWNSGSSGEARAWALNTYTRFG